MNPSEVESDVVDAIEMTRLCQALQCLPRSGGLLDQSSYDIWLMKQVLSADRVAEERNKPKP